MNVRCGECGKREFEVQNVNGKFSAPWKTFPKVFLTKDLELPICLNCGNYIIVGDAADRINAALEASIRDQTAQFLTIIKSKAGITAAKLGELVGVSAEYLSLLGSEKRTPTYKVWNLLKIIARDPKRISLEMEPNWDLRKENLLLHRV